MNEKELEDARDIRAEMDKATNQHGEPQVPATRAGAELQEGWDADEQYAELYEARLPVPRLAWNLVVANVDDVAFAIGETMQAHSAIDNLKAQFAKKIAKAEAYVERIEKSRLPVIQSVVRREIEGTKAKSIKLNTGAGPEPTKCGFRTVPGGLRIVDDEKAVAWAKQQDNPEAFLRRIPERVEPVASSYKEHFKTTGEIAEGCTLEPEEEKFFVR